MTRHTRVSPLLRLVAVGGIAALALPLSGCLYAQIPATSPTTLAPLSTETPPSDDADAGEPADGGALPITLSFDEGQELPASASVQWGDGLIAHEGWDTHEPDTGGGTWSYVSTDGACVATFWQAFFTASDAGDDDEAASDELLSRVTGADLADVAAEADIVKLGYQSGSSLNTDAKRLVAEDASGSVSVTTRVFTKTGVGLYLIVECTGSDGASVTDEVIALNPIIVTP